MPDLLKPQDLNSSTPVEQVVDLLDRGPPGPWPNDWTAWENVQAAHLTLLETFLARLPECSPYGHGSGKGIVSCVSAKSGWSSGKQLAQGYLPGAWVMVNELRRLGCTLPVTFCHLGPLEWDPALTQLMQPLGVSVIDLCEWEKQTGAWRILAGWESKVAAILACPYEEALFLDADNVPVADPTPLFFARDYQDTGAIFWPDLPPYARKEWIPKEAWASMGMEFRDEIDFESGQLLIHKGKCWKELLLTKWINEHSDRYYKVVYGDKSTFHLAWAKFNTPYVLPKRGPGWNGGAILQHDLSGRLLFEHCCQNKPTMQGYPKKKKLTHEGECEGHLARLREQWSGKLWEPAMSEQGTAAAIVADLRSRTFLYRRLGLGERELRFLEDNRIGRGAARCEFSWSIVMEEAVPVLAVHDIDGTPTMLLRPSEDGVWRGRWLAHEKCEVELTPV
jgi:hypothetical protein